MNSLIAMTMVICITLPASAQEEKDDECKKVSEFASLVMTNRQIGISLVRAIELFDGVGKEIILLAYDTPHLRGMDAQDAAVAEFRDTMAIACYRDEISIDVSSLP